MRLYTTQHQYYAGIDLHARSLYAHILDDKGKTVFERNLPASPETFLDAVQPFRKGIVVGVEIEFVEKE